MDRNLILAFALSMAVFSGWLAWQENVVSPERKAALERTKAAEARRAADGTEVESIPLMVERNAEKVTTGGERDTAHRETGVQPVPVAEPTPMVAAWEGELASENVRARLSNRGGVLVGWQLVNYFETPRQEIHVELIELPDSAPATLATPMLDLGLGDLSKAMYVVERGDSEQVIFVLRRGGVEIRKTYSRPTDDYTIDLVIEIRNGSGTILNTSFEIGIPAAVNDHPDFRDLSLVALVDGEFTREAVPSVGSAGFFGKIFGNGDEGPTTFSSGVAWAGLDMGYFSGLLMPENRAETGVTLVPLEKGKSAVAVVTLSSVDVPQGESVARRFTAFIGPKQTDLLERLGDDLDVVTGKGWSWVAPLTGFFGWALHRVHDIVPNYGLAIIILTVIVRLATWPIMARQMKSAERMRELMPRIKELQEKFKDDKQKQSEETFKLYRETGVNPLGGCLPMVVQMPVFIGLFYALQSSFDLRQAPFFLWINDLSAPATLFTLPGVDLPVRLLPILMGVSMYAQQKMTPQAGMDPTQAKMMSIMMPGMMLVISYTFPSGLVLYWMVSNVLGIAHQLYVRSKMQTAN